MLLCCLRRNIDWLLVINSTSSFPVINKWCCLSATSARTSTCLGDRSFAAAGPRLWNSLPTHLRQPDLSLGRFRRALKMHLFLAAWLRRLVTICFFSAVIQISLLTYLLTYLVSTTCHGSSQLGVLHLAVEPFRARDGARYWLIIAYHTCIWRRH